MAAGPADWLGAEVWGTGGDIGFTRDGSHAAYLRVPVAALSRKPANLSFAQAGAVGVNYVTAWIGLEDAALRPGETLLVIGATGCLAWLITVEQVPAQLALWVKDVAHQPWVFLLLVNAVLFLLGIFIEPLPALLLTAPLFLPLAAAFGLPVDGMPGADAAELGIAHESAAVACHGHLLQPAPAQHEEDEHGHEVEVFKSGHSGKPAAQ